MENIVLNRANSQRFSVNYADFWENDGGGSIKGLFSVVENAAADGIISLDEITAWDLDWTGNREVAPFSISSEDGFVTALVEPGGFSIGGDNTAFSLDFSDADGLDQGFYESGSGDQAIDLGAVIIEDFAAGTVSQGAAAAGDISISEVIDYAVNYSGFWGDSGSVRGLFSISEADAADGVASLDELIDWSFDWSGNSDVAAFSVSSDQDSVTALLPPGGFLLKDTNTAIDDSFNDPDGLDQGLYETASGEQVLDLGALIVEDFAAETLAEGDAAIAETSISVSKVLEIGVAYNGFWDDGGSVIGSFLISEADAADGVALLDELIDWSFDWSGNGDVAAFAVSSDGGSATALLPPGGFLLNGGNTPIDSSFVDADGIDQGLYQSASGQQSIDLGALIIEDFLAGTFTEGDAIAAGARISIGNKANGGDGNVTSPPLGDEVITNALFEGSGDDGIDIEGNNRKVTIKNILSTQNAEAGLEIDGSNNRVMVSSASFSDNGNDGFDILGEGNTVQWDSVASTGNAEEGFEVDGKNNNVIIRNSSLGNNGGDGFNIDETGIGNNITVENAAFENNGEDGFDLFGTNNTINWFNVTSADNTEAGFEIDGDDNIINLIQTSLSGNLDNGFQIDAEGAGNIVNISNSTIADNVDGIDINGNDNLITLFQVGLSNNSDNGIEVKGDNNRINIQSSMFIDNGEFAILIEGDNNRINILDSLFIGSGHGILDIGENNIITVINSQAPCPIADMAYPVPT